MGTIFLAMFQPLLWALPVLLLGAFLKSATFKGWIGEWQVRQLVRQRLDMSVYREFHNLTIPSALGGTAQIDHVYVSPFGVFVIETKNMGHWIWGRAHESHWTQQIYKRKHRFQNPLRQNHSHVKALEAFLGLPEAVFKPIVVFVGDCDFKNGTPAGVCTRSNLIETIGSLDERILTQDEVDRICGAIHRRRLQPSWQVHRDHVANLRRRHGEPTRSTSVGKSNISQDIIEVAGQRLLDMAADSVRTGARRHVTRGIQVGLGLAAMKALFALLIAVMILWGFSRAVDFATSSLGAQSTVRTVQAPVPEPLPTPPPPPLDRPVVATRPVPQAVYRRATPEEGAESQRRADEAMRVLAPNTPEIDLTLPGSEP